MFEVRGVPILISEMEVLYELKRQVQEHTGRDILHKIKYMGDNIMVCCPSHNNGQERRPSCGITTTRKGNKPPGTVHCFACGYIDSLEGFVSKCFGYDTPNYGENWLLSNFVHADVNERPDLHLSYERLTTCSSYVTEDELQQYRYYHPYMYQRKLTNEIIERYDVGYQKDFKFEYDDNGVTKYLPSQEVLTFPVRNEYGKCLFVSRRSIHGKNFFLPKDIDKPVYGVYELPHDCREVVICESVINALTSVAYGRPAIALFGTGNKLQYEMLRRLPIRKYILALDPDFAGKKGEDRLRYALKNKLLTKFIIPEGKDINDLTYDEFVNLQEVNI